MELSVIAGAAIGDGCDGRRPDGIGGERRCGDAARWIADETWLCNGCLMARLQGLYGAATGYVQLGTGLPLDRVEP